MKKILMLLFFAILFTGCSSKTIKEPAPLSNQQKIDYENKKRIDFIKSMLATSVSNTTCFNEEALESIVVLYPEVISEYFSIPSKIPSKYCTIKYNKGVPYVIGNSFFHLKRNFFTKVNTNGEITGYYSAGNERLTYISGNLTPIGELFVDLESGTIYSPSPNDGEMVVSYKDLGNMKFINNVLTTSRSIRYVNNGILVTIEFETDINILIVTSKYVIIQSDENVYLIHSDGSSNKYSSGLDKLYYSFRDSGKYYFMIKDEKKPTNANGYVLTLPGEGAGFVSSEMSFLEIGGVIYKNVFVTGGAGFIGGHLVDSLIKNNRVTVYDNLSSGKEDFIEPHFDNPNFKFIKGDILDIEKLKSSMEGCDFVFHLAANPDIRYGEKITDHD